MNKLFTALFVLAIGQVGFAGDTFGNDFVNQTPVAKLTLKCQGKVDRYTIYMTAEDMGKGLYLTSLDVSANIFDLSPSRPGYPGSPKVIEDVKLVIEGNITAETQLIQYTNWGYDWRRGYFEKTTERRNNELSGSLQVDLSFYKGPANILCSATINN